MVLSLFAGCMDVRKPPPRDDLQGADDDSTDSEASKVSDFACFTDEEQLDQEDAGVQLFFDKAMFAMKAFANAYYLAVPRRSWRLPTARQTLIFFDWDDTLLCTSFLNGKSSRLNLRPKTAACMRSISRYVAQLIRQARELGKLMLVTNAEEGWVEMSAEKWMPDLLPLLASVPVCSARTRFEEEYPDSPSAWKIQAFQEVKKQLQPGVFTNIISIGDSPYELTAAQVLGKSLRQCVVKTVKLRAHPAPTTLNDELRFLTRELKYIERAAGSLNLAL